MRKYNNVAQMRHFRGGSFGFEICLIIFCAPHQARTLPEACLRCIIRGWKFGTPKLTMLALPPKC